ncbi:MAG: hypothetical protein HRU19_08580 [Pseudobacteriovorax sp.]|nr:hypothetical protein [Pseudobacteriovorax sp.]
MRLLLLLLVMLSFACGPKYKSNETYYPVSETKLKSLLNADNTQAKEIYNESYPIGIKLYDDGRFRYDIPDYHSGEGTWTLMKDGVHLVAKGKYNYDIVMDLRATDETSEQLRLIFQDRYHMKNLRLSYRNVDF